MNMNTVVERYLDPAYRYDFNVTPSAIRSPEDAQRYGINCIVLAHLMLNELSGEPLPPELHFAELYADTEHFRPVEGGPNAMAPGDLVWFGAANPRLEAADFVPRHAPDGHLLNWGDNPLKHVAVHVGNGQLLHATHIDGGRNALWPLGRFARYPRYAKLYGVTRLRAGLHLTPEAGGHTLTERSLPA
jgi:cell wall-associated NlpC family hydrolase